MGYLSVHYSMLVKAAAEEKKNDDSEKKKRKTKGDSKDTSFTIGQVLPAGQAAFVAGRSPEEQNEAATNSLKTGGAGLLGALLGAGIGAGGMHLLNASKGGSKDDNIKRLIVGGLLGAGLGGTTGSMLAFKHMMNNRGLDSDIKLRHLLSRSARTEALLGGDEESQRRAWKRAVTRSLGWKTPGALVLGAVEKGTGGLAAPITAPLRAANGIMAARMQRAFNDADYE